uniref:Uncharacterized protein n=1 Tax=Mola mola TaxID=94237 RepID=A0A3Q3WXP9_MOLML
DNLEQEQDFIGGFTALHYAAMHGRARIARLMLESEFRSDIINAKSNDGWTPLHVAAHYGRDSFVRLLLEFRAEVDPLSDKGTTPLHYLIIKHKSIPFRSQGGDDSVDQSTDCSGSSSHFNVLNELF